MEIHLRCIDCCKETKRVFNSLNGFGTCNKCGGHLVRRSRNIEKRNEKAKLEIAEQENSYANRDLN